MDEGIEIFAYKWIFAKVISLWSGQSSTPVPTELDCIISFVSSRIITAIYEGISYRASFRRGRCRGTRRREFSHQRNVTFIRNGQSSTPVPTELEGKISFVCNHIIMQLFQRKTKIGKNLQKFSKKLFTNGKRCAIIIPQKENLDFEKGDYYGLH